MLALAGFCLVAVLLAGPPWTELGSLLPMDLGDPMLLTYFLAWGAHWIDGQGTTDFWSANFFWPTERPMLRSDHMLGPAAVHFLLSKLVGAGPVLSYNLLFLAAFALSGWTTCLVLRAAGTSWLAAFLGGLCFSFSPARWEQASHLQVLLAPALWPALWWFHRFLETGRIGKGLLFSVAYLAQMVCGNYLAYFLNLGLLALCLYHFAVRGRQLLSARRIASNLVVVLLCIAPVMPLYAPYALHGPPELEWQLDELRDLHASLISFLTTSPQTGFYPEPMTRSYRPENALFPGAVALGLASAALFRRVRGLAPSRRWALIILFAGLLVSLIGFSFGEVYTLDPEGIYPSEGWFVGAAHDPKYRRPLRILLGGALFFALGSRFATGSAWPLRLREPTPSFARALIPVAIAGLLVCLPVFSMTLRELLPGLAGLRVLSRAFVLVLTALSAFAALGLDDLRQALGRRIGAGAGSATAIALVLLMSFESRPRITWHRTPDPAASTNLDNFLKESDEVVAIAEFPTGRLNHNQALIMYRSINHWKPIANGYSATIPSLTREILGRGGLPSPESIAKMRGLGLSHLLVREEASELGYLRWTRALARFSRRSAQLGLEHEITLDGVRVYRIRGSSQPAESEP